MELLACPHCRFDTPAEYNFCVSCDKQIKCLNRECGKVLVRGKSFCFSCGQSVATANSGPPNKYIRTVTQQGKNYSEHTEFHASDHAVGALAPFIGGQITSPARRAYEVSDISRLANAVKSLPPVPPINEEKEFSQQPESEAASLPDNTKLPTKPTTGAAIHFFLDGEVLVTGTKDYKGKTWADQQKHFILLYAAAYGQFFSKPVPKESLKSVAEKSGISDVNNFNRYLGKATAEFFSELSQGLQLNATGEKEVARILAILADEKIPRGYEYWNRAATTPTKRQRISSEDKSKIHEWSKEEVPLGKLDVASIQIARDYALVSLWILTSHLKKAEAVRWNDAYHFFKEKYTTISSSAEAFSAAMRKELNKKYFRQTDTGAFFLSPEGQQKVIKWIAGETSPSESEENK